MRSSSVGPQQSWSKEGGTIEDCQSQEASILWSHREKTMELPRERDDARNNARCTQARKTTHSLDGQHQDVDRTQHGRVNQNGKVAVTAFWVLHGLAPRYLNQLVRVSELPGRRRLRSSSSLQLLVPPFRLTTVGRRSFPVASSLLWNSLPSDIQSSPSLPVFRQRLKHVYSGNHFLILYCDATTPLWSL